MKKLFVLGAAGIALALALASAAQARNVAHFLPIDQALQSPTATTRIDPAVRLFFGQQAAPAGEMRGAGNARGKERIENLDEMASCQASFLEGLQQLQRKARAQGANAVVNIVTYYKNGPRLSSATQFECHGGSNSTGVMLQGDFVRLPD